MLLSYDSDTTGLPTPIRAWIFRLAKKKRPA